MTTNAIATSYLKNLLGHMRKERTKGMLATRVPSADYQPTDGEEDSEELDESALERLLEGDDSPQGELGEGVEESSMSGENEMGADDESIPHGEEGRIDDGKLKAVKTMGRSTIGFSRKR